jgi:Protein of unknown function (DUF5672)
LGDGADVDDYFQSVKSLQLIALTSVQTIEHSLALQCSADLIRKVRTVDDVVMICPSGSEISADYQGRCIPMGFNCDIFSYGWIQVRRLSAFVKCDYMLNIQADGFVTTPELWDESFLDYDYIGAPWPTGLTTGSRVGNSGFSLRSRRFMEASSFGPAYEMEGDDVYWTQTAHHYFLGKGMKYAPLDVAARFAVENDIPEHPNRTPETCFGQHGILRLSKSVS